ATASRLGITPQVIVDTLYDAFGQRQVSTIFAPLNQYHVVMEVAPRFWQSPESLRSIYVPTPTGEQVPLDAVTRNAISATALSVNHRAQAPSVTISFNLAPGVALSDAVAKVEQSTRDLIPSGVHTGFSGTAQAFKQSLATEPLLILAALIAVYVV